MSEIVPKTGREAMMLIDVSDQRNFRLIVQRAVFRAMERHRWALESDECYGHKRDARDVAEAACHFLMDEIKRGFESVEAARKFAKNFDMD